MRKFIDKFGRLEIIVFVSGTVVMILELIGSRIMAPYLGTSIYIWASLIGVILGALTVGYYLGGRFSNIKPQISFLTSILFLAGIAILLIVLVKEPVLRSSMQLGVRLGSITAALILFALPSLVLGMVSPYAIRLKIDNVEKSGGVAGNLYALSTVGSILGTFLAGFYLIPSFGSTQIIFGLSLVLLLASLLGGRKLFKVIFLGLVIIVWCLYSWLGMTRVLPGFVYEGDSAYNHIRVFDGQNPADGKAIRILVLATEAHSVIYKDSDQLYSPYTRLYMLDTIFKPRISRAMTLGGGAYVWPLNFIRRSPDSQMTVVEIDPQVTAVAKKYFRLTDDARLKIIHEDGRIFLNQNKEIYDAIYGDAFASYFSIPFQLTTREAMKEIYDSLSPDGIFALNVISSLDGDKSLLFKAEYLTLKDFFPQVYIFPAYYYDGRNTDKHQNIILIATKSSQRLSKDDMLKRADNDQKELVGHLWEGPIDLKNTRVLTDDYAPVDYYISKFL